MKTDSEFFDSIAFQRDEWRKKNAYYHKELERYIQFIVPADSDILEIGCETGDLLASLKPKRGVGLEISKNMVEIGKKKYKNLDFLEGDLDTVNIEGTFDYIILTNQIGYFTDIQDAIGRLKKYCRADTRVVVVYLNHIWKPLLKLSEILGLRMNWPDQHWLSPEDIENLFYLENFEVVKKDRRFIWPIYTPFISILFNKFIVNLPLFGHLALNTIFTFRLIDQKRKREEITCTVLIPCRNEKGNIEQAILRTPQMGSKTEIIFVEGHSQDGTLEECHRVKEKYSDQDIKVIVQKGEGKGDAVRIGFDAATGDVLMILDADLTVPPENLTKFFEAIVSGKGEFINGSRLVYKMESQAMQFLNMIANKIFSLVLTYLLGQYIKDTLCGTKVIWKADYERLKKGRAYFGDFDPFGDFDLLFGAAKLNLKIVDIPVQYCERVYGSTQIRRFVHGWLLIKMTVLASRKIKFI